MKKFQIILMECRVLEIGIIVDEIKTSKERNWQRNQETEHTSEETSC